MVRVRPAAAVAPALANSASTTVYELLPAHALPTLDLSRSLRTQLLSRSAQRRLSAFMRLRGIGAAGVVGACCYFAVCLAPVRAGCVLALVSTLLYVPSLVCSASLLRYDVVLLLMTHFDFWFSSVVTTSTFAMLAVVMGDVRAVMMAYAWFGTQINIVIDANIRLIKAWVVYIMFGIVSFTTLWLSLSLDLIDSVEYLALGRLGSFEVSTKDYTTSGLVTVIALIARNLHRKRHAFWKSGTVIECVSLRTDLRYVTTVASALTVAGTATQDSATIRPLKRTDEPTRASVHLHQQYRHRQQAVPEHIKAARHVNKIRAVAARNSLLRVSWVMREALVPSAQVCSRILFQWLGVAAALLSVAASLATRYGDALTELPFGDAGVAVDHSDSLQRSPRIAQLSAIVALALALVYCGTFALHWQRTVLVELCTSFDFAFVSVQLTVVHASIGDLLHWRLGSTCCVACWWLWIHWVLTIDAVTPVMRAKLGLTKRFIVAVLVLYIAASLALIWDAVVADCIPALATRMLWHGRVGERSLELRLAPIFYNFLATGVVLCARLLSRLVKSDEDVLLVLTGALAYNNYLPTRSRQVLGH